MNIGLFLGLVVVLASTSGRAEEMNPADAAQAYRARGEPVLSAPDGNYYCEAEEFQIATAGWQALPWGANYYAATATPAPSSDRAWPESP